MMDGCMFLGFKITPPVHYRYKAWKCQDISNYVTDCVRLKEVNIILVILTIFISRLWFLLHLYSCVRCSYANGDLHDFLYYR